jgi:hypothetical protein
MIRFGMALTLAAALAACSTSRERGGGAQQAGAAVDVTRTHLGAQLARAQIAVEPVNAADANNPDWAAFSQAIERQLARHGYTVAANRPASEQIARVSVMQGSRTALTTGWPAGLGAGSRARNVVATLLDVRIQRRSDGSVFWQGRAVAEMPAGTPRTQVVERLAEALFRDFPGDSGRIIRVQ